MIKYTFLYIFPQNFLSLHMVLTCEGNLEIGARLRSDLDYLICFRHLFKSRAVANLKLFVRKDLLAFTSAQRVLSYHLIQVPPHFLRAE